MKRALTNSEKRLFTLCGAIVAGTALWLLQDHYNTRSAAARETIETLTPRFTAAAAASSDAPFWKERQAWLDATLPVISDAGQAHSQFLEDLQQTARERGLSLTSPVLLKPESAPTHQELPVNLQITGPDNAVFRWLAGLQSPEKCHLIKYLLLTPATATPPRMTATVTVARLFKP